MENNNNLKIGTRYLFSNMKTTGVYLGFKNNGNIHFGDIKDNDGFGVVNGTIGFLPGIYSHFIEVPEPTFKDRLRTEMDELEIKIDQLSAFVDSGSPGVKTEKEVGLLKEQLKHMKSYMLVLLTRISLL